MKEIDDALGFMNDKVLSNKVKVFEAELWTSIENVVALLQQIVGKYSSLDRRDFALAIKHDEEMDSSLVSLALKLQEVAKDDYSKIVIENLANCCGSPQKLERARAMLGGKVRFSE